MPTSSTFCFYALNIFRTPAGVVCSSSPRSSSHFQTAICMTPRSSILVLYRRILLGVFSDWCTCAGSSSRSEILSKNKTLITISLSNFCVSKKHQMRTHIFFSHFLKQYSGNKILKFSNVFDYLLHSPKWVKFVHFTMFPIFFWYFFNAKSYHN